MAARCSHGVRTVFATLNLVFGAELHTEAPPVGLCGGQGAAVVGFSSWARVESAW
jgi:hypothetical protein